MLKHYYAFGSKFCCRETGDGQQRATMVVLLLRFQRGQILGPLLPVVLSKRPLFTFCRNDLFSRFVVDVAHVAFSSPCLEYLPRLNSSSLLPPDHSTHSTPRMANVPPVSPPLCSVTTCPSVYQEPRTNPCSSLNPSYVTW